jgi:hypothetical protein
MTIKTTMETTRSRNHSRAHSFTPARTPFAPPYAEPALCPVLSRALRYPRPLLLLSDVFCLSDLPAAMWCGVVCGVLCAHCRYHWFDFDLLDGEGREFCCRMELAAASRARSFAVELDGGQWGRVYDRRTGQRWADITAVGQHMSRTGAAAASRASRMAGAGTGQDDVTAVSVVAGSRLAREYVAHSAHERPAFWTAIVEVDTAHYFVTTPVEHVLAALLDLLPKVERDEMYACHVPRRIACEFAMTAIDVAFAALGFGGHLTASAGAAASSPSATAAPAASPSDAAGDGVRRAAFPKELIELIASFAPADVIMPAHAHDVIAAETGDGGGDEDEDDDGDGDGDGGDDDGRSESGEGLPEGYDPRDYE